MSRWSTGASYPLRIKTIGVDRLEVAAGCYLHNLPPGESVTIPSWRPASRWRCLMALIGWMRRPQFVNKRGWALEIHYEARAVLLRMLLVERAEIERGWKR